MPYNIDQTFLKTQVHTFSPGLKRAAKNILLYFPSEFSEFRLVLLFWSFIRNSYDRLYHSKYTETGIFLCITMIMFKSLQTNQYALCPLRHKFSFSGNKATFV
uniref:Uncharacterized protein n=1 Tax=Schistocephalus solidus TaxID=70667 RepID=A0A0X3P7Y0_SCHSO